MPPGATLDVGCKTGEWACFYAQLDRHRSVIAMDPSAANTQHILRAYISSYPNIKTITAFLGVHDGELPVDYVRRTAGLARTQVDGMIPVRSIDSIFQNTSLAFAHIDVESNELDALHGGLHVFRRDRTIITAEVHIHFNHTLTSAIVRLLRQEKYIVQVVNEECSVRRDGRNIIAFPESMARVLSESPALLMAMAARTLYTVDENTILNGPHACCVPGGACCRRLSPSATFAESLRCCRPVMVANNEKRTYSTEGKRQPKRTATLVPPAWHLAHRVKWP